MLSALITAILLPILIIVLLVCLIGVAGILLFILGRLVIDIIREGVGD